MKEAEAAEPLAVNDEAKPASKMLVIGLAAAALIAMAGWIGFLVCMAFLVFY